MSSAELLAYVRHCRQALSSGARYKVFLCMGNEVRIHLFSGRVKNLALLPTVLAGGRGVTSIQW